MENAAIFAACTTLTRRFMTKGVGKAGPSGLVQLMPLVDAGSRSESSDFLMEKIAWLVLTLVTLVAAIAAQRRPRALTIGRVALGIYYVFAGALVHLLYLVRGDTYASFAEAAHFSFVRNAWRAVVAPQYLFFIGLLVVFEATIRLLVLSGGDGRRSA
jgi:hypothetical protein